MQRFDIISIGSILQDTFIRAPQVERIPFSGSDSGLAMALPLGAKLDVDTMQLAVGGGAANTSVAFARLGLSAAIISRVGRDAPGRQTKDVLMEEGVETRFIVTDESCETGQSVLLLLPDGSRTILVKRGAAADFGKNDVDESVLRRTDWIYLSSIGGDMRILRHIFAICRIHGIKLAWNPGALELAHGQETLSTLLNQADILLLNREEAIKLTGRRRVSTEEVLAHLLKLVGQGIVVVTNGAEGAVAFDGQRIEKIPGRDVPVVDATGAGDSFGSGFVAAHILGLTMEKAVSFAIANAESVIGHLGAQKGLLRRSHLDRQKTIRGIVELESAAAL